MRAFFIVAICLLLAVAFYGVLAWYAAVWGFNPLMPLLGYIFTLEILGCLGFVVYLFIRALKQRPRKD
jgi:hypothetical protein